MICGEPSSSTVTQTEVSTQRHTNKIKGQAWQSRESLPGRPFASSRQWDSKVAAEAQHGYKLLDTEIKYKLDLFTLFVRITCFRIMENFRIKHFLKKALRQSCLPWMRCDGFISSPPVWRLCGCCRTLYTQQHFITSLRPLNYSAGHAHAVGFPDREWDIFMGWLWRAPSHYIMIRWLIDKCHMLACKMPGHDTIKLEDFFYKWQAVWTRCCCCCWWLPLMCEQVESAQQTATVWSYRTIYNLLWTGDI